MGASEERRFETFRFVGRDSLSQFAVFVILFGAGCFPIPLFLWDLGFIKAACVSATSALVAAFGLRSSIVVSDTNVTITRLWFFIPYWRYTGKTIEDVWFSGDWGLEDDAMGVEVKIGGREIHIGSRKSMRLLYEEAKAVL